MLPLHAICGPHTRCGPAGYCQQRSRLRDVMSSDCSDWSATTRPRPLRVQTSSVLNCNGVRCDVSCFYWRCERAVTFRCCVVVFRQCCDRGSSSSTAVCAAVCFVRRLVELLGKHPRPALNVTVHCYSTECGVVSLSPVEITASSRFIDCRRLTEENLLQLKLEYWQRCGVLNA